MKTKTTASLSFILPVFNEGRALKQSVDRCVDALSKDFRDFEIILIDDGSTDGTGELMDELASGSKKIHTLHNLVNLNVGVSVQRAMSAATKEFVVHDAVDLPLAPEQIAGLVNQMDDCDVLVLERKTYAGYTLWRWITSTTNRILMRIFFRIGNIRDMNFTQVYRRSIVPDILPLAKSPAFTTPEMIIRALRLGLRVKSVPVEYKPRTIGKGAFGKPHDILWSLYDMLRFRLKKIEE